MPRRPGRPSSLTPETVERLVTAIKIGNYVEVAARLAGVSTSTVYRWLARGQEAKTGDYHAFWEAVKGAEAFAESSAVAGVRRGGKDWVAQMTFLERRFRSRWARPAQTVADPGVPPPAAVDPGAVTDEPVIVPIEDRLAGILEVLDRAGKMPVTDDAHTNGANGAGATDPGGPVTPLPSGDRRTRR